MEQRVILYIYICFLEYPAILTVRFGVVPVKSAICTSLTLMWFIYTIYTVHQ